MQQPHPLNTRGRLIQQNKKLRSQIVQLSSQVDQIIQKKGTVAVAKQQPPDADLQLKKKELRNQQTYISKLKSKINELRSSVIVGVDSVNRKQQDTVTQLRKELRALEQQKSTLSKLKTDKTKVLKVRDEPHQHLKSQLEELIASAKLQNRELLDKCAPLERQVRREHELVVAQKEATKEHSNVTDMEKFLPQLEEDIKKAEQDKKNIEEKWQSKIEYLDTQMIQLRAVFDAKKKKYDELAREVKNWEIRKYVYRDQDGIKEVQDRLAKLPTKPRSQTHTSKNNGKITSMSMMEGKLDKDEELRRSTSKDRFEHPSPPVKEAKVRESSIKQIQSKSISIQPSKELPPAPALPVQQSPKKANDPPVSKKDIQQQTPVKQPQSKKQTPAIYQAPSAPQTIEMLKSDNKNSKNKPKQLHVSKTQQLKPLKLPEKHTPNQFIEEIEEYPQREAPTEAKQKKLLKSIAVGTSFYYNHEM